MSYKTVIEKVSQELGLPKEYVDKVYRAYWKALRERIESIPIKDQPLEEIEKYPLSFNVPSLGKFFFNKEQLAIVKKLQDDKDKEN